MWVPYAPALHLSQIREHDNVSPTRVSTLHPFDPTSCNLAYQDTMKLLMHSPTSRQMVNPPVKGFDSSVGWKKSDSRVDGEVEVRASSEDEAC